MYTEKDLELNRGGCEILCFLNFIKMTAADNPDQIVTLGQLSVMLSLMIDDGQYPSDVAEDLELPMVPEWAEYMGQ